MLIRFAEAFVAGGIASVGAYYLFLLVNEQRNGCYNPYAGYPDSYSIGYIWDEEDDEDAELEENKGKKHIGF